MAATVKCAVFDCTRLPCTRVPAGSVRQFRSSTFGSSIICKSQRNSRYEKSNKHARQGHAIIPQLGVVVPSSSKLRSGPATGTHAKTKPGTTEAQNERGSSHSKQEQEKGSSSVSSSPSVSASVAEGTPAKVPNGDPIEEPQPAPEPTEKPSGSHWDDFWAPRLFWVFRALGTVVD